MKKQFYLLFALIALLVFSLPVLAKGGIEDGDAFDTYIGKTMEEVKRIAPYFKPTDDNEDDETWYEIDSNEVSDLYLRFNNKGIVEYVICRVPGFNYYEVDDETRESLLGILIIESGLIEHEVLDVEDNDSNSYIIKFENHIYGILISMDHSTAIAAFYGPNHSESGKSSDSSGRSSGSSRRYEAGMYKVGSDIPAGEYVLFTNSSISGYFSIQKDSTGSLDSIIVNDNFDYNSIVTLRNGEYLELNRAYAVPASSVSSLDTSGEGMFRVGKDITPGEHKLQSVGSYSGYYAVYNDSRQTDIVTNDNFDGTTYITVRSGQYLDLNRCKIVR